MRRLQEFIEQFRQARDAAQEIFILVYRNLSKFDGGAFEPWVLLLARNRCIDRLRRIKARPPSQGVAIEDEPPIPDETPGPDESWVTESKKRLVHKAIGKLSEKNREIILLKEIQGMELAEIAEMLGLPLGTVKSRSNRARLELARHVRSLDPSYGAP